MRRSIVSGATAKNKPLERGGLPPRQTWRSGARRYPPEVDRRRRDLRPLFRRPVTHVEGMRHDACPGLELLQELRLQLLVESRQEIQGHYSRFANVRFEKVALYEPHAVRYAGGLRLRGWLRDALR